MPSRAHRDYQKGFAGKIGWGQRPALLLVDVCNAYWSDASPLDTKSNPASAAAPASIAKLVAAARQGKQSTATEAVPDPGCGNGLEKWIPGLEPAAGEVVVCKRYPSAFFATDLATQLQLFNVDTVIICGVVEEACGDKSPAVHDANIADINAKMADVVFEDEAIEKLEAGWQ
ncbi:unnamed protein product [Alternaria alternata]